MYSCQCSSVFPHQCEPSLAASSMSNHCSLKKKKSKLSGVLRLFFCFVFCHKPFSYLINVSLRIMFVKHKLSRIPRLSLVSNAIMSMPLKFCAVDCRFGSSSGWLANGIMTSRAAVPPPHLWPSPLSLLVLDSGDHHACNSFDFQISLGDCHLCKSKAPDWHFCYV